MKLGRVKTNGRIACALAAASLAAAAFASLSLGPSGRICARAVPAARIAGKLGLPAELELEAGTEGGTVNLALAVRPGMDLPGATVEFLLPRGWAAVSGDRSRKFDLRAGVEVSFVLTAARGEGAPPFAGARVRCGDLSRETCVALGAVEGEPIGAGGGGVEGADSSGRRARIFVLEER